MILRVEDYFDIHKRYVNNLTVANSLSYEEIEMKPHYFDQDKADPDFFLQMAIDQGYVPKTCLLGGELVMATINTSEDPCKGCRGPREKCEGRME